MLKRILICLTAVVLTGVGFRFTAMAEPDLFYYQFHNETINAMLDYDDIMLYNEVPDCAYLSSCDWFHAEKNYIAETGGEID